ncbi:peptidylprolyl isomerase [Algivirga pacifica]|uniref:peptidylprolyl isomerase n=1 Tax=Algivirga pacifica TaxID=1162670 RepID=A0ABP9DA13_9BACT
MNKSIFSLLVISSLLYWSCADQKEKSNSVWQKDKEVTTQVSSSDKDFLITIDTDSGTMKAVLFEDTPLHRDNFIKLAKQTFYDDLLFHRVIQGFMIQGGDPDSKDASPYAQLGGGDIGYLIPAEMTSNRKHFKGAIAAARKGGPTNPEKKSSGCQFYIVDGMELTPQVLENMYVKMDSLYKYFGLLTQDEEYASLQTEMYHLQQRQDKEGMQQFILNYKDTCEQRFNVELDKPLTEEQKARYLKDGGYPALDDNYTVFGQVVEGLEVIDKIASMPTGRGDRPVQDIKMTVTVEEVSKEQLKQQYGFQQ